MQLIGVAILLLTLFHCFSSLSEILAVLYDLSQYLFLVSVGYGCLNSHHLHKKGYIKSVQSDTVNILFPQILIWIITKNILSPKTNLLAVLYVVRLIYNFVCMLQINKTKNSFRRTFWRVMAIAGVAGLVLYVMAPGLQSISLLLSSCLPVLCGNILHFYAEETDRLHYIHHEISLPIPVLHDLITSCMNHPAVWIFVILCDEFLICEWQMVNHPALSAVCRLCLDIAVVIFILHLPDPFRQVRTGKDYPLPLSKYLRASSIFYYITLALSLVLLTLGSTILSDIFPGETILWIRTAALLFVHISILSFAISLSCVKNRLQLILELSVLTGFFIWHSQVPSSVIMLYLVALTLGATGKNLHTILKIYIATKVPILIAAFFASQHGFIYNKITFGFNEIGRHSLGIVNSTDCAAQILFLIIAYCILKPKTSSWKSFIDYPILLFLTEYCYHLTGARANMFWMLLAISITLVFHIGAFIQWPEQCRKIFRALCFAITPIYLVLLWVSYRAVSTYGTNNSFISSVTARFTDTGLIQRLQIPQKAIEQYGISLFGCVTSYPDVGYGGHTTSQSNYSYIDMSYMRMLILFGILITVILMAIFLFMNIRCVIKHEYFLFAMIVLTAFTGLIEQHLCEVYYNILILAAFSNYGSKIFRRSTYHDKA